ncbi:hypothetical protein TeGR_g14680 [Tetraparma gracilis]|uniref:GDT1 family protein n=1 Tax=Tetraparma gracilis TaxID=2962635 RepID=A0ABQ6MAP8_9STRA|nr:hypothetical protein TeGR_g14680 [Tetraparma gracilis]
MIPPLTGWKVAVSLGTIFFTSADDALWLLPYLVSPTLSTTHKVVHGTCFVLGLQLIVFLSFLISLCGHGVVSHSGGIISEHADATLSVAAALIAWAVVVYDVVKRHLKRRRLRGYSLIDDDEDLLSSPSASPPPSPPPQFSPSKVFFLAFAGGLDELCYFPALLLSHQFDYGDLSLGALGACLLVLAIITFFLRRCRRLITFIDKIPTSSVVAMYAISLTIGAVRDLVREDSP